MAFLTQDQLRNIGFKKIGSNVLISDKCSIYNPSKISLGSNVRIDDFCLISAGEEGIEIGNYVHIACYVSLIGKCKIILGDFVGISSKSAIYSSSDDYSGEFLVGPTVPDLYRRVDNRPVILKRHVLIGVGVVILPGVIIEEGTAVGALSLVAKKLEPWSIFVGSPLKFLKRRKSVLLELEKKLLDSE